MSTCARQCWIFAAVMGLVVFALTAGLGGIGVLPGLFLGFATAGLLGALMVILFCQGAEDAEEWPNPVESAKDPDATASRSIRRDDGAVAQVPIARSQRPEGMEGAPQGAALDPSQAVTFTARAQETDRPSDMGPSETTDAGRVKRRDKDKGRGKGKGGALAETPKTAHSGSVGQGEST